MNAIDDKIQDFSTYLLVERGFSESSIRLHERTIRSILRKYDTIYPDKGQFVEYVKDLYKRNMSYTYIRNTSIIIEHYSEFASDPIRLGRPKKQKRIIEEVLTEAETIILIHSCKDLREKSIISTLAYSGVRVNELVNIKVRDIDFGRSLLRVIQGKNKKDRLSVVSGDLIKLLMEYLNKYPRLQDSYLFTKCRYKDQPINGWNVGKLVRTVAKRAKINKRVHPHLFRHSLATQLLMRGASITAIQQLLGHAHLETTLIYIRSNFALAEIEYRRYVPQFL